MVAEPPFLLSDRPSEVPTGAGFGDRYRYFRGASGRRYLFTVINRDELADFRSAVVLLARREPDGLHAASVSALDESGRPIGADRWPPLVPANCRVLVHLLAEHEDDRRAVVADLSRAVTPRLS
jgi:hypothetical protein